MANYYYPNYTYPNYPTYQPPQLQPQMPPQLTPQPQPTQTAQTQQIRNGGFISVPSEAVARNYPVAPGNSVTFFDENARYCYEKIAVSQLEAPIFKRYKLIEEEEVPVNAPVSPQKRTPDMAYATQEQIAAVTSEIEALKKQIALLKKEGMQNEPESDVTNDAANAE